MGQLVGQLLMLAGADAEVLHFDTVNSADLLEGAMSYWSERFADAGTHFNCEMIASELWVDADYLANRLGDRPFARIDVHVGTGGVAP